MIPATQHQCMNRGIDAEPTDATWQSLQEFCESGRIVGRIIATDTEMAVVGSTSTLLPEEPIFSGGGTPADRSPVAPWRKATSPELPSFEPEAKLQESHSPESSRGTDVSPKKASRRPSTASSRSPRVSKARSRVLPRRSTRSSKGRGNFTRFFSANRENVTVSAKKDLPSSEEQQELEDFTGETVLEDCALSNAEGYQADFDFVLENVPTEFTNCHRQSLQLRHIRMYAAQGSHQSTRSSSDRSFLSSLTSLFSSLTRSGSSSFLVHDYEDEECNWTSFDSPHSSSQRDLTRFPAHQEDINDVVPRLPWRRASCGSSTARRMLSISKIDEKGEDGICSSSDEEASKTPKPEQAKPAENEDDGESFDERLEGISSSSNLLIEKPSLNLARKSTSFFQNLRRCNSAPVTRAAVVLKANNFRRQSTPVCASRRGTDSEPQPETELPYPVRRESFMTVDSRRRQTKAPNSVSPEATTLEKKSFLKKLVFPKECLRKALTRAFSSEGETPSPAEMRSNSGMWSCLLKTSAKLR